MNNTIKRGFFFNSALFEYIKKIEIEIAISLTHYTYKMGN